MTRLYTAERAGNQAEIQCRMAMRRACGWFRDWQKNGNPFDMTGCCYEMGRLDARVSTLYDCNHDRSYEWLLRLERLKRAVSVHCDFFRGRANDV